MKPMQKESIMNETHDVDLLNEGLQGEYFAITAYDAALGTGLLSAKVTTVAKGFQADHRAHAQAIREAIERLRGRASDPKTWKEYAAMYPPPKLASETDVLQYAASLERSAAVADTKLVAKLHDPALRTLFARIGGVEAMHWALLRSTLGEPPIPDSFLPAD
jgi:Ferritin-like domain